MTERDDELKELRDRIGTILRSAESQGITLAGDPDYAVCKSFDNQRKLAAECNAREKAEAERDEALARGRLLQEALVSPAFPDDDDLDFMDRMPERSSGGKAGEEAWWKSIAEQAGYRGCMKALIGIWEVGRSETKLVKDALAGFRPIKTRTE